MIFHGKKRIFIVAISFIVVFVGLGICYWATSLPSQKRLDEALEKWQQKGADSYLLRVHFSGSFFGPHGTYTTIVKQGKVITRVIPDAIFHYAKDSESPCHITVDNLFKTASKIVKDTTSPSTSEWGDVRAIIRYDGKLGYPKYISFDYPKVGDEETRIIVLDLKLKPQGFPVAPKDIMANSTLR